MAVVLAEHDATWAETFAAEAARLRDALGSVAVEVHHVGSTAVPGLLAKPIIDITLIVTKLGAMDRTALERAGFVWRGENGIPGRRYLKRDDPGWPMELSHVHAYEADHPDVARHLAFRGALRASPVLCAGYAEVKRALPHDDREVYTDGKAEFVAAALNGTPQFGYAVPGRTYVDRPSAYLIARDDAGRVLGAFGRHGQLYLPGGGIDPGEDAATAALRELHEETGYDGEIVREVARSSQYVYAEDEGGFNKQATFFEARLGARRGDGEYERVWMADPVNELTSLFLSWAVERLGPNTGITGKHSASQG